MDTKALLLLVGNPRFKGGNASVIGGYQRYGMTLFEFVLAHGAMGWETRSVKEAGFSD
jgi:hypothetical protein